MSKLLSILIAGTVATGAAFAIAPSGYSSPSGGNTASSSPSYSYGTQSAPTAKPYAAPKLGKKVAANDKDKADKPCPPGLEKKNNGCMPPGQVNHAKAPNTRTLGAGPMLRDREHEHERDKHRISRHRKHGRD